MSLHTINDALDIVQDIKNDLLIMTSKLYRILRTPPHKRKYDKFEQLLEKNQLKKVKTDHPEYGSQKNMFESPSTSPLKRVNSDNEPLIINTKYTTSYKKTHQEFSFDNKENQEYLSDKLYSKINENDFIHSLDDMKNISEKNEKSDDGIQLLEVYSGDKNWKESTNINLENNNDNELNLSDGWISPRRLNIIIIEDSVKDENDQDSFLDDSEIEMDI